MNKKFWWVWWLRLAYCGSMSLHFEDRSSHRCIGRQTHRVTVSNSNKIKLASMSTVHALIEYFALLIHQCNTQRIFDQKIK